MGAESLAVVGFRLFFLSFDRVPTMALERSPPAFVLLPPGLPYLIELGQVLPEILGQARCVLSLHKVCRRRVRDHKPPTGIFGEGVLSQDCFGRMSGQLKAFNEGFVGVE